MPSVDLSPYYQLPGTTADGTKLDNAFVVIQSALNGLDNNNFASGRIFDPAKLQQSGAATGEALIWNGTDWDNAKPPGYELGRSVVAAGTTAISAGTETAPVDFASLTVTCDGTAVDVLSAGVVQWASGFATGDVLAVNVWLDGVDQGRVFYDQVQQAAVGVARATPFEAMRLTPSSGSRVFKLRGWCTPGGVKNLISGAGGAGAQSPAFIRVVKA